MKGTKNAAIKTHWILLGLLMLVPGLMKLFIMGPSAVSGMLSGIALFAWAPTFWAWVLILSEIIFGIAILAKWKLQYTVIPPMIILAVATLFVAINWSSLMQTAWPNVLFHLLAISGYWMLGANAK